jgi:hypothetical protein
LHMTDDCILKLRQSFLVDTTAASNLGTGTNWAHVINLGYSLPWFIIYKIESRRHYLQDRLFSGY